MLKLLFAATVVLVVAGACIAHATLNSLNRPPSSAPLKLICGLASLALIPFVLWGFFVLPWWFPLAALAIAWVIVPFVYAVFVRSSWAATFAMLFSLAGVGIGIYSVVVAGTSAAA